MWLVTSTSDGGDREDGNVYYATYAAFSTREDALKACRKALPNAKEEHTGAVIMFTRGYNVLLVEEVSVDTPEAVVLAVDCDDDEEE